MYTMVKQHEAENESSIAQASAWVLDWPLVPGYIARWEEGVTS